MIAGAGILGSFAFAASGGVEREAEVGRFGVCRRADLHNNRGRLLGWQRFLGDEAVRLCFQGEIFAVDLHDDAALTAGRRLAGRVQERHDHMAGRLDEKLGLLPGGFEETTDVGYNWGLGRLGGAESAD